MRLIQIAFAVLLGLTPSLAQDAVFEVDTLNLGLSDRRADLDLATPQSAMETFLEAVDEENFAKAAHVLDLRDFRLDQQSERGPELAEKLAVVLDRKVVLNWQMLLERPDSLNANAPTSEAMAGQARKSLLLGILELENRGVAIRLNRLKPEDEAAVWVFSRATVDNIDALFDRYGPSKFEKALPQSLRGDAFWGMKWWEVLGLPLLTLAVILAATLIWRGLSFAARQMSGSFAGGVIKGLRLPATLFVIALVTHFATTRLFVVSGLLSSILEPLILMTFVASILVLIVNVIDAALERIIDTDFDAMNTTDAEERRSLATTIAAVRRMVVVIAVLATAGIVLSTSKVFQGLGISLVASAGALTLMLGFAARSVLGNILASLQVSLNRSARIGDQLIVEDELCRVEKIHFTFIQLRHWTGNRMIVPINKFVTESFLNRSIEDQEMVRAIHLVLHPNIDIDALRNEFHRIVENDDRMGDTSLAVMLVTDHAATGMTIRFDIPCPKLEEGWALECETREALIKAAAEIGGGQRPAFPTSAIAAE